MGKQWTIPILRGVKASMFLLAVVIASSLVVIQSSRPSKAESLLYTVTCTVGALLQYNCSTKPVDNNKPPAPTQNPSEPTSPPQSDSNGNANSNSQNHTNPRPVTGPKVTESPEPLDLDEAMAGELPAIASVSPVATNHYQYPAHVWSLMNTGGGTGVLGAQTDSQVLEATDQGWRFMGLLWYWWIVIIGALTGLGALIKTTVTNSFSRIVRQS